MQKVLLLDTNVSSLPIFNFLFNSGYDVHVAGGNPNDFLAKSAPNYHNIDYSNIGKVEDLIDTLKIDYLVPGSNDFSYNVCSLLNSRKQFYGIDPPDVTQVINNKEKFRTFAINNNIPVPLLIAENELGKKWPIIIKPVDAYSGRGVTVLHSKKGNNLEDAIAKAQSFSRSQSFLIEEYFEGQLFSHSAVFSNGSILIDFIVEEHGTANPFVVDTSRVVYDFQPQVLNEIREIICSLANKLNITDGLIHTQFIKNSDSLRIIEITRRCPGDLYSLLIEFSTGFKYAESYTRVFLGQKNNLSGFRFEKSYILRHTISQSTDSWFASLKFNDDLKIERFVPLSLAGDRIRESPFGRIALLFLRFSNPEKLNDLFQKTLKRELYDIQKC